MQRIMKHFGLAVCGILLIFSVSPAESADAGEKAAVITDSLKMRNQMSGNSKVVATLKKGEVVTVEFEIGESDNAWCAIVQEGQKAVSGYVPCQHLDRSSSGRVWTPLGSKTISDSSGRPDAGKKASSLGKKRPYAEITAIIYTTSWCPYCTKARQYLQSLGVHLIEYDIEAGSSKKDEMRAKGWTKGVPFIDIEGICMTGYSETAIRKAVEQRRAL